VIGYQGSDTYQTFKDVYKVITNTQRFDEYKQETIEKLKKLGTTPEAINEALGIVEEVEAKPKPKTKKVKNRG